MQNPLEQGHDISVYTDPRRNSNSEDDKYEFVESDDHYPMNTSPKGICLIINNKNFDKNSISGRSQHGSGNPQGIEPALELEKRDGTDVDRDKLKDTFNKLGYTVDCCDDLCGFEIVQKLQDISRTNHSQFSIFVCCLLSHGSLGTIYGSDCVPVELKQLLGEVKPNVCPSLTGKPKLFFVQACQGFSSMSGHRKMLTDTLPTTDDLIPNEADFLIGFGTVPGFKAFRDHKKGSPFIAFLTHNIDTYARKHSILDILTKVNDAVSQQHLEVDSVVVKQVPSPMYTLTKPLYLDTTNRMTSFVSQISVAGSLSDSGIYDLSTLSLGSDDTGMSEARCLKDMGRKQQEQRKVNQNVCSDFADSSRKVWSYKMDIHTSDVLGAGTDGEVSIKLFGTHGTTGDIQLTKSETNTNPFEKGHVDIFTITHYASLGEIQKVLVKIYEKGFGASWHLDHVVVQDMTTFETYNFHCGHWLSSCKGDKTTEQVLHCTKTIPPPSPKPILFTTYKIMVKTSSDIVGAGTSANVHLVLCGKERHSEDLHLKKSENNKKTFKSGKTDIFTFQLPCLGEIENVRISHDNTGCGSAWHLASITVEDFTLKKTFSFTCNKWLSTSDGDKKISRLLQADSGDKLQLLNMPGYILRVKTSADVFGAGTNSNVYSVLHGTTGTSDTLHLKKSSTYTDPFETGQLDVFTFEGISSLGDLESVSVWHDNSGVGAAWHLSYIEVEDLAMQKKFMFHCGMWLSKTKEDKQTKRKLNCSNVT